MRYLTTVTGCFLLASWLTAMAGDMECGTHLITDDEINGQSKSEVREKCGDPNEEYGNNWHYKKEEGLTYILHFNDDGQLESISTEES